MTRDQETRLFAALVIVTVIPLGLIARSFRSGASSETFGGFVATYLGDTLWPVMFYFLARFVFPKASRVVLLGFVLLVTLTLEFGQLWKPRLLQWMRKQPVIGFILGNQFIWSDVVCCSVGAIVAVVVDLVFMAWLVRSSK